MRFTTMTARFPGWCKRCKGEFPAGTKIRYGGRGLTYHMAAECPASEKADSGAAAVRLEAMTARNMGQAPGTSSTGYGGQENSFTAARRANARRKPRRMTPPEAFAFYDAEAAENIRKWDDGPLPAPGTATKDFPIDLPAGSVDAAGDAMPDPALPEPKGGYPEAPKSSLLAMAAALDNTSFGGFAELTR